MKSYDLYYEIVSNLQFLGITLLTSYCFGYFLKPFFAKKKTVLMTELAYFAVMTLLYYVPWKIENNMAYGIGVIAAFLVMSSMEPENRKQKMFLSVTFFVLRRISLQMENCIDALLYHYSYKIAGFAGNFRLQFWIYVISCVTDLILSMGFLLFPVWLIHKAYVYKKEKMTGREMVILCIPSLSGMAGNMLLSYCFRVYEQDTARDAYNVNLAYNWRCFLYYGICFVVILTMIALFQGIKNRQREERQNEVLFGQIADMKRHIGEVERLYSDMQSLRHDMGNHIMTLEGLCIRNENKAAICYAARLREKFTEAASGIKSGNPVTDVILSEMQKEAEEAGINFKCDFYFQREMGIDVFDISVILNNALANAVEAAKGTAEAFIEISSCRKANVCLIEVKNSYTGELVRDEESGFPATSKKDAGRHGFGLANIQKVAQKYYGDVSIECQNHVFRLIIMMLVSKTK